MSRRQLLGRFLTTGVIAAVGSRLTGSSLFANDKGIALLDKLNGKPSQISSRHYRRDNDTGSWECFNMAGHLDSSVRHQQFVSGSYGASGTGEHIYREVHQSTVRAEYNSLAWPGRPGTDGWTSQGRCATGGFIHVFVSQLSSGPGRIYTIHTRICVPRLRCTKASQASLSSLMHFRINIGAPHGCIRRSSCDSGQAQRGCSTIRV